jgi:hypothetical protein
VSLYKYDTSFGWSHRSNDALTKQIDIFLESVALISLSMEKQQAPNFIRNTL